jgi:hypothetical protein
MLQMSQKTIVRNIRELAYPQAGLALCDNVHANRQNGYLVPTTAPANFKADTSIQNFGPPPDRVVRSFWHGLPL